jgi:polyhydroxyalkanoate synthase
MKDYKILDINSEKSLVNYLMKKGFTVFMVSWKNPDADYRDTGMEDCLKKRPVAAMSRDGDHRPKSLALLAAQTDFSEPG